MSIFIISEEHDFTMTTQAGLEVGVITDKYGNVTASWIEANEQKETDAIEIFTDDDWFKYAELLADQEDAYGLSSY